MTLPGRDFPIGREFPYMQAVICPSSYLYGVSYTKFHRSRQSFSADAPSLLADSACHRFTCCPLWLPPGYQGLFPFFHNMLVYIWQDSNAPFLDDAAPIFDAPAAWCPTPDIRHIIPNSCSAVTPACMGHDFSEQSHVRTGTADVA